MTTVHPGYFDAAPVELADRSDIDSPAVGAFLALDATDRLADTRHVHAYFRDVRDGAGTAEWLDPRVLPSPAAIWSHVTPVALSVEQGRGDDEHVYVVVECDCSWEPEHGLMMVWRDGRTLCKVGGYDGHVTNADAYDDRGLHDVVYRGSPPYRTFVTE